MSFGFSCWWPQLRSCHWLPGGIRMGILHLTPLSHTWQISSVCVVLCCRILFKIIFIFYMLLTLKSLLVNPSELADHGDLVRERIASHEIIMVLMIEQRNSCLQPFLLLWGAAVLRTHYSEPIYPPNFLFSRSSPPGPPILLSFHVHTHVSAFSSCLSFLNWLWFLVLQEGVQSSLSRLLLNEGEPTLSVRIELSSGFPLL